MAVNDAKRYFLKIQDQYLEMKQDLADYNKAFEDGYITEDQLTAVKNDISEIEKNYNRISYIMFLLNLPKRKSKQKRNKEINSNILDYLKDNKATGEDVEVENKDILEHLKKELKKLTEKKGAN